MSTPSGRPGNPISAYEPRRARERVAAEPHPSEDKTDPLGSPYAPKRAHEPAGTERQPVENDRDPLRSPYAPTRARRERPAAERHTLGADERHRYDYDTSIHRSSGRHQPPAVERRDEIMSDHDLKRLEASLRLLQRQEAATRAPRAASLPSAPRLAPVNPTGRHHSSEMPVDSLRAPRSLEPERLAPPPPMRSRRDNLRWPLAIVVASIFAAPVAYYLLVGGWGAPPALEPQTASFDQTIVAPQESAPIEMSSERTGISQIGRSSEGGTATMLQGGITGTQAPSPGKANRSLDREEIKLLTKQGEQFAGAGDLVTARILFQRAAEAGEATAAMALGATYDPNVLAKLGVAGMGADVEKARSWYRKAESQGSAEATQRLHALANR
jgi:hypothetical protein